MHNKILEILFIAYTRSAKPFNFVTFAHAGNGCDGLFISRGLKKLSAAVERRKVCMCTPCRLCLYVYVAIVHVIFMCLHAACKLACVSVQV